MKKIKQLIVSLVLILSFMLSGCSQEVTESTPESTPIESGGSTTQEGNSDVETSINVCIRGLNPSP